MKKGRNFGIIGENRKEGRKEGTWRNGGINDEKSQEWWYELWKKDVYVDDW